MGNFVAIDGSLLAYRAAAAGEKRIIRATHRGSGRKKEFDNRTGFKAFLEELNEGKKEESIFKVTDFEIEDIQIPQEEKINFHIMKEVLNYILTSCQADDYIIYLDEGKTFRNEVATVQEYKGNRKDLIKPVNLQAVKDYMVMYYPTKVVTGLEADDWVNFHQYEGWKLTKRGSKDKVIAATFDKDAFGNSGWLFDFRKDSEGKPLMKEPFWIDGLGKLRLVGEKAKDVKGWGRKFLYFQVLYGDDSDNYRANKLAKSRYGKMKAYEALNECTTDRECLQAIVDQFVEWYPEPVEYTAWDGRELVSTWLDLLQEYWDLARMRRWETDTVQIETVLNKAGVRYEK